jgi:hypothetical protein
MRMAISRWTTPAALYLAMVFLSGQSCFADSPASPGTEAAASAAKQVDDIKEIAARAIDASQHDVELVKWIFIAISAVFTLVGISAGVFNYLQLSEALKKLESFGVEQASQLSDLRTVLSEVLQGQAICDVNLKRLQAARLALLGLVKQGNKADESLATRGQIREIADGILDLLDAMKPKVVKLGSPRWRAWEHGCRGLTHLELDDISSAIACLEKAIELLPAELHENRPRLASHFYNLACAYSRQGTAESRRLAVDSLQVVFHHSQWRWKEASADADFEPLKTDPAFIKLIEHAKKRV